MKVLTVDDFITVEEEAALLAEASATSFRRSPSFLGSFGYSAYGASYGRGQKLPEAHKLVGRRMAALVPDQQFNVAFLQRYEPGQDVFEHRDPWSNKGYTLILSYGPFNGAQLLVDGEGQFAVQPRQVRRLPCTMIVDGQERQGPKHSVVHPAGMGGARYAFILNTVRT